MGRNVRVYWPIDEAWYGGVIASYDPRTKQHLVTYADGTQERLHRAEEAIRVESYVGEVRASCRSSGRVCEGSMPLWEVHLALLHC